MRMCCAVSGTSVETRIVSHSKACLVKHWKEPLFFDMIVLVMEMPPGVWNVPVNFFCLFLLPSKRSFRAVETLVAGNNIKDRQQGWRENKVWVSILRFSTVQRPRRSEKPAGNEVRKDFDTRHSRSLQRSSHLQSLSASDMKARMQMCHAHTTYCMLHKPVCAHPLTYSVKHTHDLKLFFYYSIIKKNKKKTLLIGPAGKRR